ncbi:MAG: hypothetical protein QOD35_2339 [Nocardioidaceae bacterium]|nr:hypothetical protein [Nocardioidaceae bacterium]
MERAWLFDSLCVTVAAVDFLDPELRLQPDARERGVRVEIRPTTSTQNGGTVYASLPISLEAAICRIDLLESRPGAADRMHWHPTMRSGEPGDRTFDTALSADPIGWLGERLRDLHRLVGGTSVADAAGFGADAGAVGRVADEVVDAVCAGLESSRTDWPDVDHDERGMAIEADGRRNGR